MGLSLSYLSPLPKFVLYKSFQDVEYNGLILEQNCTKNLFTNSFCKHFRVITVVCPKFEVYFEKEFAEAPLPNFHSSKSLTGQRVITTPWRNGSASDSRSEGCVFESRRGQIFFNLRGNWVSIFSLQLYSKDFLLHVLTKS